MIIVLTAFVTVVAYFLSASQTKVYEARTMIRIQQKVTDPAEAFSSLAVGQQLAKTYAAIVTTRTIRDGVRAALGGQLSQSEIEIGATPVENLALLVIDAKSPNPEVAAAVANATPAVLRNFISQTQTINDQIVTITKARAPSSPISPRPTRTAILAFLVALILNCGLALLVEFFRDRLPDVEEVEREFDKPVIGTIPTLAFASPADVLGGEPDGIRRLEAPAADGSDLIRPRPHQKEGVEGVG